MFVSNKNNNGVFWLIWLEVLLLCLPRPKKGASSESTAHYPASELWQHCRCRNSQAATQTLEDRQPVSLPLLAADIQSSFSLATCLPWHYKRFAVDPVMTTSRH